MREVFQIASLVRENVGTPVIGGKVFTSIYTSIYFLPEEFKSYEEAKSFISYLPKGKYQIEKVFIVD